jgi:hypothetical protein
MKYQSFNLNLPKLIGMAPTAVAIAAGKIAASGGCRRSISSMGDRYQLLHGLVVKF